MARIPVALVGAGRLGARHARTLVSHVPEAELRVVADARPATAEALAATLPGVVWSGDPAAVLADPAIRVVVIVTPTDTHAALIEAAAAAGKDIFCEKPVTLDVASTERALAAARAAGVRLQIGFQRRFDPDYQRVRDLVRRGDLGTPALLRATLRDVVPPAAAYLASSGGIFVDMGVHDFDAARFVLGSEVVEVYAMAAARLGEPFVGLDDADTATVSLRFANGALGQIDLSRQAVYGYDVRLEVLGTRATARIEEQRASQVSLLTEAGRTHDVIPDFPERFAAAYANELAHFVAGVTTRAEPACTGEDGRRALLIALAATESWRANRPVMVAE
jgi:myo-inositol 2-dehydrogenase/D-chiro-inositol 1-dehydrogenase